MLKPLLSTTLLSLIIFNKLSVIMQFKINVIILVILNLIFKLIQSKMCYFYPKEISDVEQDYTTK